MLDPAENPHGVTLRMEVMRRLNFAFQQNAIAVVRRLELVNTGELTLTDIEIELKPCPAWGEVCRIDLARLAAGDVFELKDVALDLDLAYLSELSERVRGELQVTVRGRTAESERTGSPAEPAERDVLHQTRMELEVFAYDEWIGLVGFAEILAAFVTPNIGYVDALLDRTADLLGNHTGSSALDGYQQKSKARVYQILECIYGALQEQEIRYCNPPASFEKSGQRIRFGEQIRQLRLATCLDLTLLFAAAMEASGLRPIILMHEGHSYAGCWLVEESFAEPVCDDLQTIRKRVELEEIVVFETTRCCAGNSGNFSHAVAAAQPHLKKDAIFECAIGIYRSRCAGIRPLPLQRGAVGIDRDAALSARRRNQTDTHRLISEREFRSDADADAMRLTPAGRVEHWRQQLLDLTLRNRLLNFKESKRTVPLLCLQPEALEDALASDQTFRIMGQSKQMAGMDPRSMDLQMSQLNQEPLALHLGEEMQARRLRSTLVETETNRRLLELYRRSRMEMEESGANSLFLAIGFLEWRETDKSDQPHRAPLLLVPVRLDRKSVSHGFSLQRIDEETLVNVTLLELLQRDFKLEVPGVQPLPEDENGVDVGQVFWRFQQAVKEMTGWEVTREVWLGQFSFNKFLLWKDLSNQVGTLTRNAVVRHLIEKPGEPFFDAATDIAPEVIDDTVAFDEIFCPVSTDSSQLAAVISAARGKNFVMRGPPGTGKSQTITNLIAHCLAEGKRVLFVAEKRAALEVVQRRLSQIGLGPFCLELHSNKSGKADVLRQFSAALDVGQVSEPEAWESVAMQLQRQRAALNDYVRALHKRYPNGFSAYHGYSWLIAHRDEKQRWQPVDRLVIPDLETHTAEHYQQLLQVTEDLQMRGSANRLSPAAMAALRPFAIVTWTPALERQWLDLAHQLTAACDAMAASIQQVLEALGLPEQLQSRAFLEDFLDLGQCLLTAPVLPERFLTDGDWLAFRTRLEAVVAQGRLRDDARSALAGFDLNAVLQFALGDLPERVQELSKQGGLMNRVRIWWLLKPVRKLRLPNAGAFSAADAHAFFVMAKQLQDSHAFVTAAGGDIADRLGAHWQAGEAYWDKVEAILAFGDEVDGLLARIAGTSMEALLLWRSRIGKAVQMGSDMLAAGKPVATLIQALLTCADAWQALENGFREALSVDSDYLPTDPDHLRWLQTLCQQLHDHSSDLQNWSRWQMSYQQAMTAHLGPLLQAVESGSLALANLQAAFRYRYFECFVECLITREPVLREFWGDEQEQRIQNFSQWDERYTRLTADVIVARLAGNLPRARAEASPRNSELGILQRERAKKARHKPVRRLLGEIPHIMAKLKPCFLMSPLSVAQYLDLSMEPFDLVVFDEASQIPVWDAIGSIARGSQVIVVGDPKQLPPTNFFGRTETDDEAADDGTIQDLESILDECMGSGLHVCDLRWHYRSRKEGLIAFSNYHYYDNHLHTFPAPHAESVGVTLIPVPDGYYDKGRSRTNPGEADAITAEVVRRLLDPELCRFSIGIVTFSQAQQMLVLDKLDQARREYPQIEGFFDDSLEEPVFVKNLENVQGDERDVIIFSVCYGPDPAGKVSMNFGPLNREGGERRLNVAVTRAKHDILVFSTLRSEQIDLTRTRAIGAAHLKSYLEYAERGPRALPGAITSAAVDHFDSAFEQQVAEFLRQNGYEVHTQVGCSGYRIDLALVAPESPGRYLLGIECDGATYHRAATARDRDRLRQLVLEGLGWRFHRIWSTDWWRNFDQASAALLRVVEQAVETFASGSDGATPVVSRVAMNDPVSIAEPVEESSARDNSFPYPAMDTQPGPALVGSIDAKVNDDRIRKQLRRIIDNEGPLTESLLLKRVAAQWDIQRITRSVRERILQLIPAAWIVTESIDGERVYWPEGANPDSYRSYRIPTDAEHSQRALGEIPDAELGNALEDVLRDHLSLLQQDAWREALKKFGILRLTAPAQQRFAGLTQLLIESGRLQARGDQIVLP